MGCERSIDSIYGMLPHSLQIMPFIKTEVKRYQCSLVDTPQPGLITPAVCYLAALAQGESYYGRVGVALRTGVGVKHFFGLFPDGIQPGSGVFVLVAVAVLVGVDVLVAVFVGVLVGVGVAVSVGVFVGVGVEVSVGVFVGVGVEVLVGVLVGVFVGVGVDVSVGVLVAVGVEVLVGVFVGSTGVNVPGTNVGIGGTCPARATGIARATSIRLTMASVVNKRARTVDNGRVDALFTFNIPS